MTIYHNNISMIYRKRERERERERETIDDKNVSSLFLLDVNVLNVIFSLVNVAEPTNTHLLTGVWYVDTFFSNFFRYICLLKKKVQNN